MRGVYCSNCAVDPGPSAAAEGQSARLDVFIPTFDRPDALCRTVGSIVRQLRGAETLTVLDNASAIPAAAALAKAGLLDDPRVRVVRHAANIGGNANICRCMELCAGEWLWIVGDDDPLLDDALDRVRAAIAAAPADCFYLGYGHAGLPEEAADMRSPSALLASSRRGIGDILFMTTGVLRIAAMRGSIRQAYQWLSTCAPHLVLLFDHWTRAGGMARLHRQDVRCKIPRLETGGQSQMISFCLAILPHLPMAWAREPGLRAVVADRFLSPEALIYESLLEYRRGRQGPGHAFRYFAITARLKYGVVRRQFETARFIIALVRCMLVGLARKTGLLSNRRHADQMDVSDRT